MIHLYKLSLILLQSRAQKCDFRHTHLTILGLSCIPLNVVTTCSLSEGPALKVAHPREVPSQLLRVVILYGAFYFHTSRISIALVLFQSSFFSLSYMAIIVYYPLPIYNIVNNCLLKELSSDTSI